MKTWLRKLRGIVSIGALWGIVGSIFGLGLSTVITILWHDVLPTSTFRFISTLVIQHGIIGFILGTGFSSILTLADGRKTLNELTPGRAALWGALSGVGFMSITGLVFFGLDGQFPLEPFLYTTGLYGLLTAGLGAGTMSLAKRDKTALEEQNRRDALLQSADSDGTPRQFGPVWSPTEPSNKHIT